MKKLWFKVKLLFGKIFGKAKNVIEKNIEPAIKVVNLLKDLVENPAMNIIVAITPFNWDDVAVKYAKNILPKVLLEMNILKTSFGKTNAEIIQAIVAEIRSYTPNARAKFYEDLSSMLAADLSDGKFSANELSDLVKFIYEEKFKNK